MEIPLGSTDLGAHARVYYQSEAPVFVNEYELDDWLATELELMSDETREEDDEKQAENG